MTTPLDTSTPRKRFPKWTLEEQDVWLNAFEAVRDALIEVHIGDASYQAEAEDERTARTIIGPAEESIFEEDISLAARLADRTVTEVLYRFHIQEGVKRRPPVKKRGRR